MQQVCNEEISASKTEENKKRRKQNGKRKEIEKYNKFKICID